MSTRLCVSSMSSLNMFAVLNSDDDSDTSFEENNSPRSASDDVMTKATEEPFDISTLFTMTDEVKALQDALNSGVSWYDVMYPNNEEIKEIIRQEQNFESSSNTNWTTVQKKKKAATSPPSSKKNSKRQRRN
jgi:hypothetical protein